MIRESRLAGSWYEGDKDRLINKLEHYFQSGPGAIPDPRDKGKFHSVDPIVGVIVPHAGHVYSGWVAAFSYYKAYLHSMPQRIFLVGPNHRGIGHPVSIYPEGVWKSPLGETLVDDTATHQLLKALQVSEDPIAHELEHSLEIQLPFIQYLWPDAKIVPVLLADQSMPQAQALGNAIATVFNETTDLLVASSDFSHYVSSKQALAQDQPVIRKILEKDVPQMYQEMARTRATLCGYGAIATLLTLGTAKYQDARVEQLKYADSGYVSGDSSSVVAYGAFAMFQHQKPVNE